MTVAHVANASTVREELAEAEEQAEALHRELIIAQRAATEARRAGAAVLGAAEAAMAPLMAELAVVRRACRGDGYGDIEAQQSPRSTCAGLEVEIQHLRLDIAHFQSQVDRLQAEDRHRSHELGRLRGELAEASENLAYEQHRVRHYDNCRQLGLQSGNWAGLSPSGLGRRTVEVREEQKLREKAEQRLGGLSRNITVLASNAVTQHSTIEKLGKRLQRVQSELQVKDQHLVGASKTTAGLQAHLRAIEGSGDGENNFEKGLEADDNGGAENSDGAAKKLAGNEGGSSIARGHGARNKSMKSSEHRRKLTGSTGKLPQLSF